MMTYRTQAIVAHECYGLTPMTVGRIAIRADAEIAALKVRIAELEAAQRWISVDERLPDAGDSDSRHLPPHVSVSYLFDGKPRVTTATYSTVNGGWATHVKPTHWRPLPEPPKPEDAP